MNINEKDFLKYLGDYLIGTGGLWTLDEAERGVDCLHSTREKMVNVSALKKNKYFKELMKDFNLAKKYGRSDKDEVCEYLHDYGQIYKKYYEELLKTPPNELLLWKKLKSPLTYQGSKFRLLDKILPFFPNKINVFYDVFCGSGVVGTTVYDRSNLIILNDVNEPIINILKQIIFHPLKLCKEIEKNITLYDLRKTKKTDSKEFQEKYKNNYLNFRKTVNENVDKYSKENIAILNYILHLFSFNGLIRFNQKSKFNASYGFSTARGKKTVLTLLKEYHETLDTSKIILSNKDFRKLDADKLNENDFLYFDPPYLNTTAVYNENRLTGWNENDEIELLNFLEKLDRRGIKWGMSNSLRGKCGTHNERLKEWSKNFTTHYFDKQYQAFGQSNKNNIEVYITNYEKEKNNGSTN